MSNFNRNEFIKNKINEYAPSIKGIIEGAYKRDASKIAQSVEDLMSKLLGDAVDSSIKDADEADRKARQALKKKVGFYHDGKWFVINSLLDQGKINALELNHDGSTYGKKGEASGLYPEIDKNRMWYGFKSIAGDALDFVVSKTGYIGVAASFFINIKEEITSNHIMNIDYKDINSSQIKEKKYVIYNAKEYESILNSHWGAIGSDINNPNMDRVILATDRSNSDADVVFYKEYKDRKANTFEFRTQEGDESIISFLKRIDFPNDNKEAHIKFSSSKVKKLIANYYGNFGANASRVSSDIKNDKDEIQQAAAHALSNLVGYVLEGDTKGSNEYTKDLSMYSDRHINDRAEFFQVSVKKDIGISANINKMFIDTKTGKRISGGAYTKTGIHGNLTAFVDGKYEASYQSNLKTIYGYSNSDTIISRHGTAYIEAGLGGDKITTGSGNDTIYTNANIDDKFDQDSGTNTVHSGSGNDTIHGSKTKDIVYGEDGEDTIRTKGGNDIVYGGNDKDTIYGGSGNDELYGGDGNDTIYGEDDNDKLYGDKGEDTIHGGKGDDTIEGGESNDTLYGGDGSDTVNGGSGNDTIYGGNSSKGNQIGATTDNISNNGSDEQNVLIGGAGEDSIYGTKGNDIVYGDDLSEDIETGSMSSGSNKDKIYTYDGDDIIYGGGDDDIIYAGDGNDTIHGGDGNDNIYASSDNSNSSAAESGADDNTIYGGKGDDHIYSGKGSDTIDGGEGNDNIHAGDGNNTITDMDGSNTITAGKDSDNITTGDRNDSISAGDGADTIKSGGGNDTLSAGSDNDGDRLEGEGGYDKYYVHNNDTIMDSDGKGEVWFNNSYHYLTGGVETSPGSKVYKGGGYTYRLNGRELSVTQDSTNNSITIENFKNKDLHIDLKRKIGIEVSDASGQEGDPADKNTATINITLTDALKDDEKVTMYIPTGVGKGFDKFKEIVFTAGVQTVQSSFGWNGDFIVNTDRIREYLISPISIKGEGVAAEVIKSGTLSVTDDDLPVDISVQGSGAAEAAEKIQGHVNISRSLKDGEYIDLWIGGSKKNFKGKGDTTQEFNAAKWSDDKIPEEDSKFYHNVYWVSSNTTVHVPKKGGRFTIMDDDRKKPPQNPRTYDPLVIDLNKDGVKLTELNPALNFDHDANGFKEATGWISNADAFLTYDKNGNGIIDDGSEMFGETSASNGFEALKKFDSNKDDKIDEEDLIWQKLSLWRDINSNAKTEDGELISITDTQIESIDLNYSNVNILMSGNTIKQTSKVRFKDGSTANADDVNFEVDLSDTVQAEIQISKDILNMPNLEAKGNVYDLHSAMMKDYNLRNLVNNYMDSKDESARKSMIKSIIFKWTKTENIDINSRGDMKDARELGVYEALMGEEFIHVSQGRNPRGSVANMLHNLYQEFEDYVYANLELQVAFKDVIDTEYMYYNHETNALGYKFDDFNLKIKELYSRGKYEDIVKLISLVRQASVYKPNLQNSLDSNLKTLSSDDSRLSILVQSQYIKGTDNNDTLQGDKGNDILEGGAGNDNLDGGAGNDIYLFGRGDGQDTIYNNDNSKDRMDVIRFKEGVSKNDLTITRDSNNSLVIRIKETQDTVTVSSMFYNEDNSYGINKIEFYDGTSLNLEDIKLKLLNGQDSANNTIVGFSTDDTIYGGKLHDYIYGQGGKDTLYGNEGDDRLEGQAGNDTLYGNEGKDTLIGGDNDDTLYGNEGNDSLQGDKGNDILEGGAGNDNLDGGAGNDIYLFGRGDGQDTIYNNDNSKDRMDVIRFKEGVSKNDLTITRDSNNSLVIRIKETQDTVTVSSMFYNEDNSYGINKIEFYDGTSLNLEDIKLKLLNGQDSANNTIVGFSTDDTIYGGKLHDYIYGQGGKDTLYGNEGDDRLEGQAGNDTLYGNEGKDTLIGGDNDDTLYGNEGNDSLQGDKGNDILEGGAGNDNLDGGAGNDIYLFGRGDGQDTIYNNDNSKDRMDVIRFKEGVSKNDLTITRDSNNSLVIRIKETQDTVTVSSMFYNEDNSYGINKIEFYDGTSLNLEDIKLKLLNGQDSANNTIVGFSTDDTIYGGKLHDYIYGQGGKDTLYGNEGDDRLEGQAGNDTLYGNEGKDTLIGGDNDDTLYGNEGNDSLQGDKGNDILEGGAGNDNLDGGAGNDIYLFGRGDGQDTIYNNDNSKDRMDVIKFKEGISKRDISFMLNGSNLSIKYSNEDTITLSSYNSSPSYQIDKIELNNGNFITNTQINKIIQDINAFAKDNGISSINHDTIRNNNDMMNIVMNGWNG
ncbi:calcium-binding protein [Campylobacter sp. RM16192]|uniref:calcium-binding protein n=1 Tax=Campylobacter sp. RM16192 TaxID=1660080 RepID=UPI00145153F9|nr:calcium-binding protein [Campylobacter sp. RM16192]QCD51753.1 RTX toxin related Ca2+-binding protein [Campylobacter sp. RM16192]